MLYSISGIRVKKATQLIWLALSFTMVQPVTIQGQLSDMGIISDVMNYVKPYIKALRLGPQISNKRANVGPSPEQVIDAKIQELQPYLQDNDMGEKLELEGDEGEETTIIEFTPKAHHNKDTSHKNNKTETFEENIRRYKKQRNKIKNALVKESVSEKTKKTVIKMIDELIGTVADRKCPERQLQNSDLKKIGTLKSSFLREVIIPNIRFESNTSCFIDNKKLSVRDCEVLRSSYFDCIQNGKIISDEECRKYVFRDSGRYYNCYINGTKISGEECKKIINKITEDVTHTIEGLKNESHSFANMMKHLFDDFIKKTFKNSNTVFRNYFDAFTDTVFKVLRDSDSLSNEYKVKCTLVNTDKTRRKSGGRQRDICQDFRACSEELREFLNVFYRSLNDTAVRAFRNYEAMYERDIVGDEDEEKKFVISILNKESVNVEHRVAEVFAKMTTKIKLDKNKIREANVAILKQYVKDTIKNLNKTIVKHIEEDLKKLRAKLLFNIKEDLQVNLAADLNVFELDVVRQMCSFFITCKGNLLRGYENRKQFIPKRDSRSVFVKVELTMDNGHEDKIDNNKEILRSENVIPRKKQPQMNITNVVTRTTTKSTTTPLNMNIDTTVTEDSYEDYEEGNEIIII